MKAVLAAPAPRPSALMEREAVKAASSEGIAEVHEVELADAPATSMQVTRKRNATLLSNTSTQQHAPRPRAILFDDESLIGVGDQQTVAEVQPAGADDAAGAIMKQLEFELQHRRLEIEAGHSAQQYTEALLAKATVLQNDGQNPFEAFSLRYNYSTERNDGSGEVV